MERVVRELARQSSLDEFVEHGALQGLVVLLNLVATPAGKVGHSVVDGVEPVRADEGDGVGQYSSANGTRRTDATSRVSSGLDVLNHQARIELDHVGMGV